MTIESTLAALGPKRRPLMVVAAEFRDAATAAGDHPLAAFWNSLAATIADIEVMSGRCCVRSP